jgi:3-oxoacyl-[acyl-carrier protein] reductase
MNRTVVVTGGNRGIGQAIVNAFSQQGDKVCVLDMASKPDDETQEILKVHGGRYFPCDVRDRIQVNSAIATLEHDMGTPDVLVNNVGLLHVQDFLHVTEDDWDLMFTANVKSLLFVTQPIAQSMAARNRGVIINMASLAGKVPFPGQSVYGATKAAVIQLTKSLSVELGPHNIRVNSVCPGILFTKAGEQNLPSFDSRREWKDRTALRRLGNSDEVANVVTFLASPAADYITGESLNVTGGLLLD